MRKLRNDNKLRGITAPSRPAFTLAELVVAMGVLVLMLVLAGQVFNLTVKSTGQATALVRLNQSLRALERTVRDDLRHTYPGESLILIQGNPVNTYWTPDGFETDDNDDPSDGYPHEVDPERETEDGHLRLPRADLLMLFPNRPGRSYVSPEIQSNIQQVVYGHAELGEYVPDPDWREGEPPFVFEGALGDDTMFPAPPVPGQPAVFPASSWHLARRTVHLLPTPEALLKTKTWDYFFENYNGAGLADPELLESAVDVIVDFDYETLVQRDTVQQPWKDFPNDPDLTVVPDWHLPVIFGRMGFEKSPFARSRLDVAPPALYADRLGHYMLPNCASFKVEWTLNPRSDLVAGRLDGLNEILWIDPGKTDHPVGLYDPTKDDPLASIEEKIDLLPPKKDPGDPDGLHEKLKQLLTTSEVRADNLRYTVSDRARSSAFVYEYPPVDPPSPWTPLTSVLGDEPTDFRANTQVFLATRPIRPFGAGSVYGALDLDNVVPDDVYPTALRITIDVYDPQRHLERPMRHVIIATVGG